VASAVGGGVLGSIQPPVNVQIDSQGYHIGAILLPPQGIGTYAGEAGAVVIEPTSGQIVAGGSTKLHGENMLGRCLLAEDRKSESCRFQLGTELFSAQDSAQPGVWKRRYEDGQTVEIRLPGGITPVPIAIGR
ncbi:MAG: hypothetical protein ACREN8_03035, partial [Candidatus Dormibacteraceae bacterium]